jgi:hypothetical protein
MCHIVMNGSKQPVLYFFNRNADQADILTLHHFKLTHIAAIPTKIQVYQGFAFF